MTTVATFNQPIRIITYGMIDAGLLQEGDDPTSDQIASGINRLNDIINLWGTQGLKLWTYLDQSITLTASTGQYVLGPAGAIISVKPMRAIQGYYLDSSNVRRPIYPLSWDEWLRLSQVTQTGAISQYFVNKQKADLYVNFWQIPDTNAATGTAHLLLPRQITNFTGITDTMDFPQEWLMGLRWAFADDICTGQPQAIMDRCQMRAQAYRTMLEDWDVEDAPTQFQPDTQGGNAAYGGSFT